MEALPHPPAPKVEEVEEEEEDSSRVREHLNQAPAPLLPTSPN